jgi:sec-independent protein translocase protein TatC
VESSSRRGKGRGERRMSLGEHLTEFRRRIVRAAIGLLLGAIAGWFLSGFVLDAMRAPITAVAQQQHRLAELNYDNITGAFDLKIQIAITIGVVISSPIWLYQLWAFFVPALNRKELKYSLGFFFSAVPLFLAGCAAGWLVVPHMVQLLTSFVPGADSSFIQASDYFSFILKLVLAIGIAFVLPVFLVLLNFIGILSGSAIIKSWRIALLAIMVFTAVATPSADVVSMFLLAAPMILLYFGAAAIAQMHDRRIAKSTSQLTAEYAI